LFYQENSDTTSIQIKDSPLVDKEYTAQWEAKTYLVKFMMDDQVVDQQVVSYGEHANYVNQTKDGYTFPGWFSDEECTNTYEFSNTVTSDLILYGKFIASEHEYIVIHKYLSVDGNSFEQDVVHHTENKTDDFIAVVPIVHRD
jgi:uncharacterized repeat protein (TIGR02543 family)